MSDGEQPSSDALRPDQAARIDARSILLSILSYLVPQIDGRSAHNSTKRVTLVNSVLPPRRAPFGGTTSQDHMVPLTKNLPPLNHDDGCLTEDQRPRKTGSRGSRAHRIGQK
jgi:hypothetical protein